MRTPIPSPACRSLFIALVLLFPHWHATARAQTTDRAAVTQDLAAPSSITQARIRQAIDENNLVVLHGGTHPLARPEYDRGAVPDAEPLNRMLLLLRRSADQEAALQQFLDDQQNKSSPNYHQWVTPEQFGRQYGPADADILTLIQWLTSQGFSQINVGPGRNVIEFSGTAGRVRNAFNTEIHRFVVNGQEHTANIADPQIPAALAPVVTGIVSLHNFPKKSHTRVLGQFRHTVGKSGLQPLFTFPNPFGSGNLYGLGPDDFAVIYNTKPLLAAANDGTGQTIAVVGETNIKVQDVQQFRAMFGLPANFDATNVVLNGEDPGITSVDEEAEADLDVQWSGAVAPGATIKFVVSASTLASAGIDLSALYIVENNLAPVMSESYGACEKVLGSAGNAFYNNLWEQAAAQGITVIVSSGDGGSAGCDDFNTQQVATQGLAVSGLASTPYNVSLGGTDFDQVNNWAAYWNPTNDATGTSAKSYIPEIPWNENCAQIGLNGCGASARQGSVNIVAGSGGPSSLYTKPKWQVGVAGMPNDNRRDQPDVSLLASSGFNGTAYIYCQSDHTISGSPVCNLNAGIVDFGLVGGTSAAAPAFAGIMALVNQKQAALGNSPRQGNANNILYALANKAGASCASGTAEASGCIFNDVARGNSVLPTGQSGIPTNSVPCQGGSLNCSLSVAGANGVLVDPAHTTTEAWTATAGYDMTTGLGSVNVNSLAAAWGAASGIGTTTNLTLSPTTGIKHGSAENVVVNITVKANTGTGTPTGDVSLIASFVGPPPTTQGLNHFTLGSTGTVTNATTQSLPGGTYNVMAHYAGDGINAPSDSPAVQVTVSRESSQTFIVVPTFDSQGNLVNGNATSVSYGSNYIIRMYATNSSAIASSTGPPSPLCAQVNQLTCPSGSVSLTGNGTAVDKGVFALNNAGYTRDLVPNLSGGTYPLVAQYSGDNSYNSSSATESFTVTRAVTSLNEQITGTPVVAGQPSSVSVTGYTQALRGPSPTGTVTFFDGTSQLGSPIILTAGGGAAYQPAFFANGNVTMTTAGSRTLVAQYSGDTNFAPSTTSVTVNVLNPTTAGVTVGPTSVNYGATVTVTATIDTSVPATNAALKPTGTIGLYASHDGQISSGLSVTTGAGPTGNWEIRVSTVTTPQFTEYFSIYFNGDSNYAQSNASSSSVSVAIPDFTLSPASGLTLQPVAGQAASAQITITPATSTPSTVNLSAILPGPVISGYAITITPQQVSLTGAPVTATISFNPTNSNSGTASAIRHQSVYQSHFPSDSIPLGQRGAWWTLSAVSGLACCFALLISSGRKRFYYFAGALGPVFLLALAMGCGGGSSAAPSAGGSQSGSGGAGSGSSPVTTSINLSTSNVKVPYPEIFLITATITSAKPVTGTVAFYNYGQLVTTAQIFNGQAQTGTGYINNVGLYQITASYSGDANNQPSSTSSPLTQVITGSWYGTFQAQTGGDVHSLQVLFGLQ